MLFVTILDRGVRRNSRQGFLSLARPPGRPPGWDKKDTYFPSDSLLDVLEEEEESLNEISTERQVENHFTSGEQKISKNVVLHAKVVNKIYSQDVF
jgi:hypothetical protein